MKTTGVRIGTGTSSDPFRPDLSALATDTQEARFVRLLKENPDGTMECEYEMIPKRSAKPTECCDRIVAGTATQDDLRECLAYFLKIGKL